MSTKPTRVGRVGRILQVCLLALVLTGCITVFHDRVIRDLGNPAIEYPERDEIDLNVELRLTDEFSNSTWEGESFGYTFRLSLEKTLSKNAEIVAKDVFQDVVITKGATEVGKIGVGAILTPRVVFVRWSWPMWRWEIVEIVIHMEWTLTDLEGELIWIDTVEGVGKAEKGNIFTNKKCAQRWIQEAIVDLFLKTFDALSSSPEIREFAAAH